MNHYRIVPKDDELYHWKYVRKEKLPNGKWKYYYKNDRLGIKEFIDTNITGNAYKQHRQELADKEGRIGNRLSSTRQDRIHAEQTSKGYSQHDPKVRKLQAEEAALETAARNAKKEFLAMNRTYYDKSLRGVAKSTINSGRKAAAHAIEKLIKKSKSTRISF